MYKLIAANKRNTVLIMIGFIVLIGAIGFLFAWYFEDWGIAGGVFAVSVIYALFQYYFASKVAVAMTGANAGALPCGATDGSSLKLCSTLHST